MAGKPPHQPQTPFNHPDFKRNLFSNILKGELDVPRSLSFECQSLLRGLMTRDPVKRLGSMVGKGRPPRCCAAPTRCGRRVLCPRPWPSSTVVATSCRSIRNGVNTTP